MELTFSQVERLSDFEYDVWDRSQEMGFTTDEFWNWYMNGDDDMGTWKILRRDGTELMTVSDIDAASNITKGNDELMIEYASDLDISRSKDMKLRPMEASEVTL